MQYFLFMTDLQNGEGEENMTRDHGKERVTKMLLDLRSVRRLGGMRRKELSMRSNTNLGLSLSASLQLSFPCSPEFPLGPWSGSQCILFGYRVTTDSF